MVLTELRKLDLLTRLRLHTPSGYIRKYCDAEQIREASLVRRSRSSYYPRLNVWRSLKQRSTRPVAAVAKHCPFPWVYHSGIQMAATGFVKPAKDIPSRVASGIFLLFPVISGKFNSWSAFSAVCPSEDFYSNVRSAPMEDISTVIRDTT